MGRGQDTDIRCRISDVRGKRTEVRSSLLRSYAPAGGGQMSDVRGQMSEVRGQRSEVSGPGFVPQWWN